MNLLTEIEKIADQGSPDREALARLLAIEDPSDHERLMQAAYETKRNSVRPVAYFRGLVEFSNVCTRNCHYCGIRRDSSIHRFSMSKAEIMECAAFAFDNHYGSVVLQSGERDDAQFVDFVEDVVREIKRQGDGALGITLSCGEQTEQTYRRWFAAGAHRYLLRIETSDPKLYSKLHPADQGFDKRVECLRLLQSCGYQVGTGVMIGIPHQTAEHLAGDITFFREMDIDMIGMGPYVLHEQTPLAPEVVNTPEDKRRRLDLALRMIALTRIIMPDVNIAAATALQALHPQGREKGLKAGANVVMPNLTPKKYREDYLLYEDKPCAGEEADMCRGCLERRIQSIGETVGWGKWGDSKHFFARQTRK